MNLKWEIRFLEMAKLVSGWSKDPSTKTGAVIVRPNRTVQSVGFNGFPTKMPDSKALYLDRVEKYSRIIHCEINALLFAEGSVKGSTLFTYPFCSCDRCAVQMIQAGIVRFVFPSSPVEAASRWEGSFQKSKQYFKEARIPFYEVKDFQ